MSGPLPSIRSNPDGTAFNEAFAEAIRDNGLLDYNAMMALDRGGVVKHAIPQRKTVVFTLRDGNRAYLKRHFPAGLFFALKKFLLPSFEPTAFDEFENIVAFHRAGLLTVTPIAAGRQRGSYLITHALDGCTKLDDYLGQAKLTPRAKAELISSLADVIQKMHAAGFNHRDLYLCHILRDEAGKLYIVDLHRVQRRARVPERWLVKDIAALNYSAPAGIISRTDRLRFLKAYLGTERLAGRDKRFVLKVLKKTQKMVKHNARCG
jgi:heptose I phosphotransferase